MFPLYYLFDFHSFFSLLSELNEKHSIRLVFLGVVLGTNVEFYVN